MRKNNLPSKTRISREIYRQSKDDNLERAKNIAAIFSAIAVPIVLTIAGYFIQRQITDDGLKKDYVAIASAILKEDPKTQEPDLRSWAVKVLEENSPVPFSKKAKEGLLTGAPIVLPGPAWLGPPEDCRTPPKKRYVFESYKKLTDEIKGLSHDEADKKIIDFIEMVVQKEADVLRSLERLKCIQQWTDYLEKSDIEYRESIGAPSSKSVFEEIAKQKDQQKSAPSISTKQ